MAKRRVRVGVVGTGFGRYHMEGFSKVEQAEIVAICDLNQAEARSFAEQYGAKHVFGDYREMNAMDELDAVSIAVPNCYHAPIAIDALRQGKHVLVEKPMALNPKQANAMVAAAKKAGKRLMVEQALRFKEETQLLRAQYDRGVFGDVYYAKSTWIRRKGWPKLNFAPGGTMGRGEWFIQKKMAGFGALGDIGVHLIDLAWYLMGTPKPVSVSAMLWTKVAVAELKRKGLPCEVDEMAAGTVRFEGGRLLNIDVCWDAHNEPTMDVRIFGDKGGASVFPPKVYRGEDIMETTSLSTTYGGYETVDPYGHFIDCICHPKKALIASGEENVSMIKMLDGFARSARLGKEVSLR